MTIVIPYCGTIAICSSFAT